ncbi:hypothetical protein [Spirosoma pulveris]
MKKILLILTGIVLLSIGSVKAGSNVSASIMADNIRQMNTKPQIINNILNDSEILALFFGCASATSTSMDINGNTVTGSATCCSNIDAVAAMCAQSRADANLSLKLYSQL